MKYIPTKLKKELNIANIVSVHYHEYTTDFSYSGEEHDFYELIYCDKGELEITAGADTHRLKRSEAYIHPCGQFHNVKPANDRTASSIVLSFNSSSDCLEAICGKVLWTDRTSQNYLAAILRESKASFENLQELVFDRKLVRKTAATSFASEQALGCNLELLLIQLVRQDEDGKSFAQSRDIEKNELLIKDVCQYMRDNLAKKLTFSDIVSNSLVSSTTLKYAFKKNFGHGAMEHLSIMRTEHAKELLREGKYTCTEIASLCGFFSVHHFCRVFKNRYEITPTEYVKTVKSQLEYPEKDN